MNIVCVPNVTKLCCYLLLFSWLVSARWNMRTTALLYKMAMLKGTEPEHWCLVSRAALLMPAKVPGDRSVKSCYHINDYTDCNNLLINNYWFKERQLSAWHEFQSSHHQSPIEIQRWNLIGWIRGSLLCHFAESWFCVVAQWKNQEYVWLLQKQT